MGNEFFVGHLILLLSVVHTSCISEWEKYQGKLYKGPTVDTPTKGVRKQEQWLEKIQDTAKSTSLDPKIAQLMEAIASYPNVPRKRKKFEGLIQLRKLLLLIIAICDVTVKYLCDLCMLFIKCVSIMLEFCKKFSLCI